MPSSDNPIYAFIDRQLALVGDDDPLGVMAGTADALRAATRGVPEPRLDRVPAPGRWSPKQQLAHVADMEWVFGFRARTILCDLPAPVLQGIDQERWVSEQHPERHPAAVWLDRFDSLRRLNLELWRGLSADQLLREGRHAEAGIAISLGLLRRIIAGHDRLHLARLRADLAA